MKKIENTGGWQQALFLFPPLSPRAPASQAEIYEDLLSLFVKIKVFRADCKSKFMKKNILGALIGLPSKISWVMISVFNHMPILVILT